MPIINETYIYKDFGNRYDMRNEKKMELESANKLLNLETEGKND